MARQRDDELGPFAGAFARDLDRPVVEFDEAADEVEPDPQAALSAVERAIERD